ncbi:MAG: glutamyl-tRNA reductase [Bryobacteraceae bacterium]
MNEQVVMIGVDFQSAPIEVREQFALFQPSAQASLEGLLGELRRCAGVEGILLLGTCNRTELYAAIGGGELPRKIKRIAETFVEVVSTCTMASHLTTGQASKYLRKRTGTEAVAHLFRVAAGVEYQILGDTHILRQVRESVAMARTAGVLGALLDRVAGGSLKAGRRVRREMAIGTGASSVGGAILRTVRKRVAGDHSARILLLGAGRASSDIADHFAKAGFGQLRVAARRAEEADGLAARTKGRATAWQDIAVDLRDVDCVVCATSAVLPEMTLSVLRGILEGRRHGRELLVIDVGVPRNCDPAISSLNGIRLISLDELQNECAATRGARQSQSPIINQILAEEIRGWLAKEGRRDWCHAEGVPAACTVLRRAG